MDEMQLPDDLNPEVVKATSEFIGKITGLVPPPHNAFPPEWHGYLRTFTVRLAEIARESDALSARAEATQAVGAPTTSTSTPELSRFSPGRCRSRRRSGRNGACTPQGH